MLQDLEIASFAEASSQFLIRAGAGLELGHEHTSCCSCTKPPQARMINIRVLQVFLCISVSCCEGPRPDSTFFGSLAPHPHPEAIGVEGQRALHAVLKLLNQR